METEGVTLHRVPNSQSRYEFCARDWILGWLQNQVPKTPHALEPPLGPTACTPAAARGDLGNAVLPQALLSRGVHWACGGLPAVALRALACLQSEVPLWNEPGTPTDNARNSLLPTASTAQLLISYSRRILAPALERQEKLSYLFTPSDSPRVLLWGEYIWIVP